MVWVRRIKKTISKRSLWKNQDISGLPKKVGLGQLADLRGDMVKKS